MQYRSETSSCQGALMQLLKKDEVLKTIEDPIREVKFMDKAAWSGSHRAREARIVQGYQFLCRYMDEHGYPPTVLEMERELGYRSESSVNRLFQELERRGFIRKQGRLPKTITILSGVLPDSCSSVTPGDPE